MREQLGALERFLSLGLGLGLLIVALSLAFVWFRLRRFQAAGVQEGKKARPLPKHRFPAADIDPKWTDDNYERMIAGTHQEILGAIRQRDRETLAMLCPGPALASYASRLDEAPGAEDLREALQGSVRQSWDPASQKLVTILAVTRWAKGWRRFYEEWTLQRQGNAWFLLDRKPTKL